MHPAPIVAGIVVLVVLWLIRPIWHGLAMFFWTAPIVWLPPLLLLGAGVVLLRRSRRSWATLDDLRAGVRPPVWLIAFPALAFLLFVLGAGFEGPLVGRAIVKATTYEAIDGLPPGGLVRLVPREVAEQNASSGFNSPTETLTNFRIVNTDKGLVWTALRTPQGAFRVFTKKSQGLVELDAEDTARTLRQDRRGAHGRAGPADHRQPALAPAQAALSHLAGGAGRHPDPQGRADRRALPRVQGLAHPPAGARWRLRRRARRDDRGPLARGGRARGPSSRAAAGSSRTPRRAASRTPTSTRRASGTRWFVHEDQTRINDTETNRQPYLVDFGTAGLGLQWVTVAEPYGRAFAASAIFLTDAITGHTRIWRVPRNESLSGNVRALQTVRSVAIPGVDFGNATGGSGNFRVVEPRPVFVRGHLVYLASIIPNSANAVSKTVVVDAETNKLVAIFNNDTDPQADLKTRRYIETGQVPGEAAVTGTNGTPATPATTGTTTTPAAGGTSTTPGSVADRLDDVLRRQRELLDEVQKLRDDVGKGGGG